MHMITHWYCMHVARHKLLSENIPQGIAAVNSEGRARVQ